MSVLVFSKEHSYVEDFSLSRFGRFSHSKNYIQSLIKQYGFELIAFKTANLRTDGKKWVKGGLHLARCILTEADHKDGLVV